MAKYQDPTTGEVTEIQNPELYQSFTEGKIKVPDSTPLGLSSVINADALKPSAGSQFQYSGSPSLYPVGSIDPFGLSGPEQQAQGIFSDIYKLNESLYGQSAFKTQKEGEFDISGLTKTQKELSSKIKSLQKEALAIPLQLQQDVTGKGVTKGGLAPIEKGKLYANAVQALQTSALLEAANGNLTLAMDQVDKAVAQKYDPIKEQIAVKMANLELIMKSPEYTNAEKKKAQAQIAAQNAQALKIQTQEGNMKAAQAMASAAIANNPDSQAALFAAQQVLGLDPGSPNYLQQVFGLVGKYQSDPNKTAMDLVELEYKKAQTAELKASAAAKWEALKASSTQLYSGLSTQTAAAVKSKVTKFATEQIVQNFQTIQEGYNFAASLSDTTQNPADDQALVYALAKALDPNSVVKEGEYKTALTYSQSWVKAFGKGIEQAINGTGFLSKEARENIKKTIESKYLTSKQSYDNTYNQYIKGINLLTGKVNAQDFLIDYAIPGIETSQGNTVTVNGNEYTVGQIYQDGSGAKWKVDANGSWTKLP